MNVSYKTALINPESVLSADPSRFEQLALQVFRYQHANNELYRLYCDALHINAADVNTIVQIPFLPVSFFKTHKVITGTDTGNTDLLFESSGTTGENTSRHYVKDANIYERSL